MVLQYFWWAWVASTSNLDWLYQDDCCYPITFNYNGINLGMRTVRSEIMEYAYYYYFQICIMSLSKRNYFFDSIMLIFTLACSEFFSKCLYYLSFAFAPKIEKFLCDCYMMQDGQLWLAARSPWGKYIIVFGYSSTIFSFTVWLCASFLDVKCILWLEKSPCFHLETPTFRIHCTHSASSG